MNLPKIIALRHELHQHPELSGEERETKRRLMEFLQENCGLAVTDRGKWFYAEYHPKGDSRGSIAFRADFDAIKVLEKTGLPYQSVNKGVAHQCGHDGHSAALAAFAIDVWEKGADKDVYFIFQHGEETGIGGAPCAALIDEKQIDQVFAVHNYPGFPFGSLGLREGTVCCASKGLELIFTGTSAHASQPEMGKNPAFAVSKTVTALQELADPSKFKGLTLATVVQIDVGERAFGVAAHKGKLLLTIRGQHEAEMNMLQEQIEAFAKNQAEAYGLELEKHIYEAFPETYNHPESIEKIRALAVEKGWPITEMQNPIRSSEDFGYYLKKAPGALIWLGAGENLPSIHAEDFDYQDELIPVTLEIFNGLLRG
ncbi:amidohydrolase [Clostridiales Family XIII bacterium PM5-7]